MLSMGEGKDLLFQEPWFQYGKVVKTKDDDWVVIDEHGDDDNCDAYSSRSSSSSTTSSFEASMISNESSSSSIDFEDDASSSSISCLSSSNSSERLYDLSEIMAQLPIKKGLSKFYQGKSESFTCLSRVTSIEDLAKKITPYTRKMKTSKSYGGLDAYKSHTLPKRVISKKGSFSNCKPPMTPGQKNSGC